MATPGWYPDPAGQPGAFRYWDGSAWGNDLRGDPFGAPPAGAAPHQPGPPPSADPHEQATVLPGTPAPTPQSYQPSYHEPQRQPGAAGWEQAAPARRVGTTTLVVVAVLLAIGLGVGSFFVVRSLTDGSGSTAPVETNAPQSEAPTDGSTDGSTGGPTDGPTDGPSTEPSTEPTQPVAGICTDGSPEQDAADGYSSPNLTGGGLSMPPVDGFDVASNAAPAFTFADGVLAPSRTIQEGEPSWAAVFALGGLSKDDGFTSPQEAATTVLECMVGSESFYRNVTSSEVIGTEEIEVDGAPAAVLTAAIEVDVEGLRVPGDHVRIVVVDTGDPAHLGLYVAIVPLDDPELIAIAESQVDELRIQ